MEDINIVVVGNVPPAEIEIIKNGLQAVFNHTFKIYARIPMPQKCLIPERGQYNALCILEQVLKYPGYRVVGIVSEDMAFEGYNFLLGLAAKNERGCIVSVHRLRASGARYFERVKKEIMHELGHTFGLKHCDNRCVMQFSNSVVDVDIKPAEFCDECASRIREHLR